MECKQFFCYKKKTGMWLCTQHVWEPISSGCSVTTLVPAARSFRLSCEFYLLKTNDLSFQIFPVSFVPMSPSEKSSKSLITETLLLGSLVLLQYIAFARCQSTFILPTNFSCFVSLRKAVPIPLGGMFHRLQLGKHNVIMWFYVL